MCCCCLGSLQHCPTINHRTTAMEIGQRISRRSRILVASVPRTGCNPAQCVTARLSVPAYCPFCALTAGLVLAVWLIPNLSIRTGRENGGYYLSRISLPRYKVPTSIKYELAAHHSGMDVHPRFNECTYIETQTLSDVTTILREQKKQKLPPMGVKRGEVRPPPPGFAATDIVGLSLTRASVHMM